MPKNHNIKKEFVIDIKVIDYWMDNINTWMGKDGKIGLIGKSYILAEWSGELHLLEKEIK